MFENILGMLRKRRRLDEDADDGASIDRQSNSSGSTAAASMFASGLPTQNNMTMFWDSLFGSNDEASNTAANNSSYQTQQYQTAGNNTSNNLTVCIDR